jgi:hypothetical protein
MKSTSFGIKEYLENNFSNPQEYRIISVINKYDDSALWDYLFNWNMDSINYSFPKET